MANIRFVDGFDRYADMSTLASQYTFSSVSGGALITGPRFSSGQAIEFNSPGALRTMRRTLSASNRAAVGFWHKSPAFESGTRRLCSFESISGSLQFGLIIRSTGSVFIQRGTSNEGESAAGVYDFSGQYVEIDGLIHGTAGWVKVWIDGVLVLDLSGINTQGQSGDEWTVLRFDFIGAVANQILDDMYVADERAEVARVVALSPNSDISVQFTPSTGSDNFANADELINSSATTPNNVSSTAGHVDRYGLENLPFSPPAILAVQPEFVARNTANSSANRDNILWTGANTELVDTFDSSSSGFSLRRQNVYSVNPDTSVPWTEGDIAALNIGVRLNSIAGGNSLRIITVGVQVLVSDAEEPSESETPSEEPSESETPSEEPSESETPSEEPSESEIPSEMASESEMPSEEPSESETPSEMASESETPSEEPSESESPAEPIPPVAGAGLGRRPVIFTILN